MATLAELVSTYWRQELLKRFATPGAEEPTKRKERQMARFTKKPVYVEAYQWDGTEEMRQALMKMGMQWLRHRGHESEPGVVRDMEIMTPSGRRQVEVGYWLVKSGDGAFYPWNPVMFAEAFDPAPEGGK